MTGTYRLMVIEGEIHPTTLSAIRSVLAAAQSREIEVSADHRALSIADLIAWVSFQTGVAPAAITGPGKANAPVRARTAVAWGARELIGATTSETGRRLGGRDHSTIRHALARAERWVARDPAFQLLTSRMLAHFKGLR